MWTSLGYWMHFNTVNTFPQINDWHWYVISHPWYLSSNVLHCLYLSTRRSFDLNVINIKPFECTAAFIVATYYRVLTASLVGRTAEPSRGRAETSRCEVVEERFQSGRTAADESGVHLENPDGTSIGRRRGKWGRITNIQIKFLPSYQILSAVKSMCSRTP